jgi:hypothetical protein
MRVEWQVENNEFCREVLKKHWPKVPCHYDITHIDWRDITKVDLICGGFPCQPRSVLPGSEEARRMTVTSGRKWSAALTRSGPLGSLARMCLGSSIWHSTKCVLIWKVSATPSGRSVYRLVPSMPRTSGNGSGLWPTPNARDHKDTGANVDWEKVAKKSKLAGAVMWPTPHANCHTGAGHAAQGGVNLQTAVKSLLPTPTANRRDGLQSHGVNIVSGSLNPTWVEWLMGYPLGWTVLEASATPSSRRLRRNLDE